MQPEIYEDNGAAFLLTIYAVALMAAKFISNESRKNIILALMAAALFMTIYYFLKSFVINNQYMEKMAIVKNTALWLMIITIILCTIAGMAALNPARYFVLWDNLQNGTLYYAYIIASLAIFMLVCWEKVYNETNDRDESFEF